jgi:tellurite resistance protein
MDPALKQDLLDALTGHREDSDAESRRVEPELVAELALWAATADGELRSQEVATLASLLRELPGLEAFDSNTAVHLVYAMAEKYTTEAAIAGRVTEIAMTIKTPRARRAAYQLAVWAAAYDGHVSEEESDFLEVLQDCLEITDADAEVLLHAAMCKSPK